MMSQSSGALCPVVMQEKITSHTKLKQVTHHHLHHCIMQLENKKWL